MRSAWSRPRRQLLPSPIFLGLLALLGLTGWLAWRGTAAKPVVFLFVTIGWVVSLCLHEFSHALVAYRMGDRAVADRGYLTLNPLRYTNAVLSIILPVLFLLMGGIAFPGGAVWIDRDVIWRKRQRIMVSLAGPAVNLLFGLALAVPFWLVTPPFIQNQHEAFWAALGFLGMLQIIAALLNLLPVPGLDGGNALEPLLDYRWQQAYAKMAPYGMLVLFLLLATGPARTVFFGLTDGVCSLIGLPSDWSGYGSSLFRFWAR